MIGIEKLNKSFPGKSGSVRALIDVDLTVERGEFFVLLGPSGSGKTTLLRCVAGLERPDSGEIALGARAVFSSQRRLFVPAEERELGMVFQSYAIWPHLTVFENVALPLKQGRRRLSRARLREKVDQALRLVEMEEHAERPAPLLSGGQQQRIALARALAVNPQLLLMDEPLSNLDARLREEVRSKIRALVSGLGITALYVTHDQVEAMVLADRIAVMAGGKVLQVGSPYELYRSPSSARVAEFFGSINWLDGRRIDESRAETDIGILEINGRPLEAGPVVLGIRPEDLRLGRSVTPGQNEFEGEIVGRTFAGDQIFLDLKVRERKLCAKTMADGVEPGARVSVHVPRERVIVFRRTP